MINTSNNTIFKTSGHPSCAVFNRIYFASGGMFSIELSGINDQIMELLYNIHHRNYIDIRKYCYLRRQLGVKL